MVLQIRFAIWLTLQIEVEALHICKPSHHFASTISAFHVGLRPPHPARFLYARPPSLPRAPALPPAAARGRHPRTDANDDGDERRTGLGGEWHARRMSKWREGKKRAIGEKKSGVGSTL